MVAPPRIPRHTVALVAAVAVVLVTLVGTTVTAAGPAPPTIVAVGDIAFQKKCMGRLGDVAHSGRTVVFVSHQLEAVQRPLKSRWLTMGEEVLMLEEEIRQASGAAHAIACSNGTAALQLACAALGALLLTSISSALAVLNYHHVIELETLKAIEAVRNGAIGDVTWVRSRETHTGPHSAWFWDGRLTGGGASCGSLRSQTSTGSGPARSSAAARAR